VYGDISETSLVGGHAIQRWVEVHGDIAQMGAGEFSSLIFSDLAVPAITRTTVLRVADPLTQAKIWGVSYQISDSGGPFFGKSTLEWCRGGGKGGIPR